jgi:hypothetical protein
MVDKDNLEGKLKLFITKHDELIKVINDNITLSKKVEGAIETIQLLLGELQDQTNTEQNANKA